jgi:hypothetical protein
MKRFTTTTALLLPLIAIGPSAALAQSTGT